MEAARRNRSTGFLEARHRVPTSSQPHSFLDLHVETRWPPVGHTIAFTVHSQAILKTLQSFSCEPWLEVPPRAGGGAGSAEQVPGADSATSCRVVAVFLRNSFSVLSNLAANVWTSVLVMPVTFVQVSSSRLLMPARTGSCIRVFAKAHFSAISSQGLREDL